MLRVQNVLPPGVKSPGWTVHMMLQPFWVLRVSGSAHRVMNTSGGNRTSCKHPRAQVLLSAPVKPMGHERSLWGSKRWSLPRAPGKLGPSVCTGHRRVWGMRNLSFRSHWCSHGFILKLRKWQKGRRLRWRSSHSCFHAGACEHHGSGPQDAGLGQPGSTRTWPCHRGRPLLRVVGRKGLAPLGTRAPQPPWVHCGHLGRTPCRD